MRFIEMSDYNRAARAYWWVTTLLGASTVAWALGGLVSLNRGQMLSILALTLVVHIAGLYPIRVPSTQVSITPTDIFVFLTALYFGAAPATLVAVADALAASLRTSRRWTSRIGGPALMSIAVGSSASLFEYSVTSARGESTSYYARAARSLTAFLDTLLRS